MAANSYFYGLTADKKLVGGDTALITTEQQKEELLDWFKARNCIVGFIATHWECGFVNKTNKTWFGDRAYELELYRKLEERYPGED
jgi:hypothetical protein